MNPKKSDFDILVDLKRRFFYFPYDIPRSLSKDKKDIFSKSEIKVIY